MHKSQSVELLAAALAKAQATLKTAEKTGYNPHFKSRYADLAAVWDAARAALTANGLSVMQDVGSLDNGALVTVTTTLLHSSGQWVECGPLAIPALKRDAQAAGSAITYARRYSLAAAVGVVAADEDDDANAAAAPAASPGTAPDIEADYAAQIEHAPDLDSLRALTQQAQAACKAATAARSWATLKALAAVRAAQLKELQP